MSLLTMFALYALGAVVIGLPLGRKAWKVWDSTTSGTGGFWGWIFFPMCASEGEVGSHGALGPEMAEIIGGYNSRAQHYIALTMIFWLPRIFVNLITGAVVFALSFLGILVYLVLDVIPRSIARIPGLAARK